MSPYTGRGWLMLQSGFFCCTRRKVPTPWSGLHWVGLPQGQLGEQGGAPRAPACGPAVRHTWPLPPVLVVLGWCMSGRWVVVRLRSSLGGRSTLHKGAKTLITALPRVRPAKASRPAADGPMAFWRLGWEGSVCLVFFGKQYSSNACAFTGQQAGVCAAQEPPIESRVTLPWSDLPLLGKNGCNQQLASNPFHTAHT